MEINLEKSFMTKTGYCQILPDKIIIARMGAIGDLANATTGNNIARTLVVYTLLSVFLFYLAYEGYLTNDTNKAVLFGLLGSFLLFNIIRSINNSTTPIIYRSSIKDVKFVETIPGLTRSYFKIKFENENGKLKQRLIMLPGSLSGGNNEKERAVKIFKEEKLLL